jgi:hypothetical protein
MNSEMEGSIGNGTSIDDIKKNVIKRNKLASSIGHKMDEYNTDSDSDSTISSEFEKPQKHNKTKTKKHKKEKFKIPEWGRDPLIILCLYILLSIDIVKLFIGKYIKIVNPDENGNVGIIGNIIFGIILCSLFILIKKFISK